MKPIYKHMSNGTTICTLRDKAGNVVYGYALCHPEEKNPSDRVGEYIATIRAEINYYKLIRRIELKPQIKTLGHLLACINNTNSKSFDSNSPEAKLIRHQFWMAREDYNAMGDLIKELEKALKDYISNRDKVIEALDAKDMDKNK